MPDEPNGKIDELLKSYAQKRREEAGAPLELHPATRKLLQGEVTRLHPKAEGESRFNVWALLWPRMGWVMSILAAVAVAVVFLMPALAPAPKSKTKQTNFSIASAKDKEQLAPKKLADRVETDLAPERMIRLETAPPEPDGNAQSRLSLAQENENPSAAPAPIDAVRAVPALAANAPNRFYQISPARSQDDRKEAAGFGIPKAADGDAAGVGKNFSLRDSGGAPAIALNSRPDHFRLQGGVAGGESFDSALAPASPFSDGLQTNGVFLGASLARPLNPVPSQVPNLAQINPKPIDLYYRKDNAGAKEKLALNDEQAVGLAGTYAAVQNAPVAALGGRVAADQFSAGRQRFKQIEPAPEQGRQGGAARAAAVLDSFELVQEGDRIRILDADGSVYEGKFTVTEAGGKKDLAGVTAGAELRREMKKVETSKTTAAAAGPATDSKAQNISLRAIGTNRSLNQLVVFDCTLGSSLDEGLLHALPAESEPGVDFSKPAQATAKSAPAIPQTVPPPAPITRRSAIPPIRDQQGARMAEQSPALLLTRCQGVARIGTTNQIQINAVRVAR